MEKPCSGRIYHSQQPTSLYVSNKEAHVRAFASPVLVFYESMQLNFYWKNQEALSLGYFRWPQICLQVLKVDVNLTGP